MFTSAETEYVFRKMIKNCLLEFGNFMVHGRDRGIDCREGVKEVIEYIMLKMSYVL